MNKNNFFDRQGSSINKTPEVHPVWRGIGFILMIFIPILSFLAASVVLDLNNQNGWFMIPAELFWSNQPKLINILAKVGIYVSDQLILAKLVLTVIISFIAYTVFTLVTFLMNRLFGPPRYQVPDVPPLRRKNR